MDRSTYPRMCAPITRASGVPVRRHGGVRDRCRSALLGSLHRRELGSPTAHNHSSIPRAEYGRGWRSVFELVTEQLYGVDVFIDHVEHHPRGRLGRVHGTYDLTNEVVGELLGA